MLLMEITRVFTILIIQVFEYYYIYHYCLRTHLASL
jgi:hypothetical protein